MATLGGPQSTVVSPTRAHFLAYGNLLTVFGNSDETTRLAAIPSIYTEDVVIYEPDTQVQRGHSEVNTQVTKLLSEQEGWSFTPSGSVKSNHDCITLKWGFGPKGPSGEVDVKMTGQDVIFVENSGDKEKTRIKAVYVLLDGPSDVTV